MPSTIADCTIAELAGVMKEIVGYTGRLAFDTTKPDGTPRKVLNVDKMKALGWAPKVSLEDGLARAYAWAIEHGKFYPG